MKWLPKAIIHSIFMDFASLVILFPGWCGASYGTNDLWLEMALNYDPVQTNIWVGTNRLGVVRTNIGVTMAFNNSATFVIHAPATNVNYIYNLSGKTDITAPEDWTWLAQSIPGQTNLVVSNLPPDQCYYRLGVTNIIRPGFDQRSLTANDDGSTDRVPLGFEIVFYGNTNSTLYVNNNGDVTFDSPQSEYSPKTLASLGVEVIAPYWADVDTRNELSEVVKFGTNTVNGCKAFGVNWVNVGYYSVHGDKLLSCQLVIISRSDIAPGDFDMEFNYSRVEWQWGDVTVGNPPRAGFANSSVSSSYELPGSGVDGAFMDTNKVTGLIYNSRDSAIPGRYFFQFRAGVPLF
jgi:hypothetical protein